MNKCTTKHIRKKYNSVVAVDSCQNDPVNALEWTDSGKNPQARQSRTNCIKKNIHLLMLLKMVDCQK